MSGDKIFQPWLSGQVPLSIYMPIMTDNYCIIIPVGPARHIFLGRTPWSIIGIIEDVSMHRSRGDRLRVIKRIGSRPPVPVPRAVIFVAPETPPS
jgi:hypothetical protein